MTTISFALMVGFLIAHELDAVKRHEWRMLPLVRSLPEKTAEQVFIWAHIPLAMGLVWIFGQGATSPFALALSGFAVIHIALHWGFRKHPRNEFNNRLSWAFIFGAGLFGIVHLLAMNWGGQI